METLADLKMNKRNSCPKQYSTFDKFSDVVIYSDVVKFNYALR